MAGKPSIHRKNGFWINNDCVGFVNKMLTCVGSRFTAGGHCLCVVKCDCGAHAVKLFHDVKNGRTWHCGCMKSSLSATAKTTHGRAKSSEYKIWSEMKNRCSNPKCDGFHKYGARGIVVCERWESSFEAFLNDMGERPSKHHSIDRKDNSSGYSPENCVWADPRQQARNRRSNVWMTFYGKTMVRKDWAKVSGVDHVTIIYRIKRGWSERDAVWTPVNHNRRNRRAVARA